MRIGFLERRHGTHRRLATTRPAEEGAMKPAITGQDRVDHDERFVHNWRVLQLTRLGVSRPLAETCADRIDWHQVARLRQRGWRPQLAVRIVG